MRSADGKRQRTCQPYRSQLTPLAAPSQPSLLASIAGKRYTCRRARAFLFFGGLGGAGTRNKVLPPVKLSEVLDRVIALATARSAYWDQELPKRCPDYPVVRLTEDFGPPPPEEEQLREFLRSLPAATVYMLTLIMYLGRRDFAAENLLATYEEVSNRFNKPEEAVSQMLNKAVLAQYLSEGRRLLTEANFEIDRLLE